MGIRVEDIAFVGFRAPDLSKMRAFMEDFGAIVAYEDEHRLFMRGAAETPFLHVTERGEAGFAMIGLRSETMADLKTLAAEEGVKIEALDAPGGGSYIDLRDPDGNIVRVVAGQRPVEPVAFDDPYLWNFARSKPRLREVKRIEQGPPKIVRLGHAVLSVSDFRVSEAWYKQRFGFITSDEVEVAPGIALGAFMRCDRGSTPTDHHTLFLAQFPSGPGFNHAAFEVRDIEDVLSGHSLLKDKNYTSVWGIGRHYLGSQVFDYWRDPWGHTLEHWTDGDMFTADDAPRMATVADLVGAQWGPPAPSDL